MTLKIDKKTRILYKDRAIDAQAVEEDYKKWEGARKVELSVRLSEAPMNYLVFKDICGACIEIVRDKNFKKLTIKATAESRRKKNKYNRPYSKIILTPVEGAIESVRYARNTSMRFDMKEADKDCVAFNNIGNSDLEMIINYRGR